MIRAYSIGDNYYQWETHNSKWSKVRKEATKLFEQMVTMHVEWKRSIAYRLNPYYGVTHMAIERNIQAILEYGFQTMEKLDSGEIDEKKVSARNAAVGSQLKTIGVLVTLTKLSKQSESGGLILPTIDLTATKQIEHKNGNGKN